MLTQKKIGCCPCVFGSDPELFIQTPEGRIVGSELVIPPGNAANLMLRGVVRDGVQVELHPDPSTCRQTHSQYIQQCLARLHTHLSSTTKLKKQKLSICFRPMVELSHADFEGLSESSRMLGCAPSLNYYNVTACIRVDPLLYMKRSAGGHIHLGLLQGCCTNPQQAKEVGHKLTHAYTHREQLPPLLDTLVGNTAVLVDRDPNAAERREVYGRAGEYRLTGYGLEYRTLSNFWLRSYPLYSLFFALARQATYVLNSPDGIYNHGNKWDAAKALLKRVDLAKVEQAINNNDAALAWENWEGVKQFLWDHVPDGAHGLNHSNIKQFEWFAKSVQQDWLESWWPESEQLRHWLTQDRTMGWENFAEQVLKARMGVL